MSRFQKKGDSPDSGEEQVHDHQSEIERREDELEDFFREQQKRKEALPKK